MLTSRAATTRRLQAVVDSSPSRIPVLLGGCGSGRTTLLGQLHERLGRSSAQSVDVGRVATTPERFHEAVGAATPFPGLPTPGHGARAAFDATLAFLSSARTGAGTPATFILDEFLELRTFESFPGLRRVLHDFIDAVAVSENRFVLSSRYVTRTLRLLKEQSARFEIIHVPPMGAEDAADLLGPPAAGSDAHETELVARSVQSLGDGRPVYVRALVDELEAMRGADPVAALVALLSVDGRVSRQCAFTYELRLHRARGYGALKAILDILADEEGLTLTEISHRLRRTPGSTKDYLSWLEDVDLVASRHKRYSFTDPMLRVWVRLHCRAAGPTEHDIVREVHRYAGPRLPKKEPALAMAAAGPASSTPSGDDKRPWGIIEID